MNDQSPLLTRWVLFLYVVARKLRSPNGHIISIFQLLLTFLNYFLMFRRYIRLKLNFRCRMCWYIQQVHEIYTMLLSVSKLVVW